MHSLVISVKCVARWCFTFLWLAPLCAEWKWVFGYSSDILWAAVFLYNIAKWESHSEEYALRIVEGIFPPFQNCYMLRNVAVELTRNCEYVLCLPLRRVETSSPGNTYPDCRGCTPPPPETTGDGALTAADSVRIERWCSCFLSRFTFPSYVSLLKKAFYISRWPAEATNCPFHSTNLLVLRISVNLNKHTTTDANVPVTVTLAKRYACREKVARALILWWTEGTRYCCRHQQI